MLAITAPVALNSGPEDIWKCTHVSCINEGVNYEAKIPLYYTAACG